MTENQATKLWGYLENIQKMLQEIVENKKHSSDHNEIEDGPQDEGPEI